MATKRGTKGKLQRSPKARAKKQELRAKYVDTQSYINSGSAFNKAKKLYGKSATVYNIGSRFYAGKKSTNSYLKGLVAFSYR